MWWRRLKSMSLWTIWWTLGFHERSGSDLWKEGTLRKGRTTASKIVLYWDSSLPHQCEWSQWYSFQSTNKFTTSWADPELSMFLERLRLLFLLLVSHHVEVRSKKWMIVDLLPVWFLWILGALARLNNFHIARLWALIPISDAINIELLRLAKVLKKKKKKTIVEKGGRLPRDERI